MHIVGWNETKDTHKSITAAVDIFNQLITINYSSFLSTFLFALQIKAVWFINPIGPCLAGIVHSFTKYFIWFIFFLSHMKYSSECWFVFVEVIFSRNWIAFICMVFHYCRNFVRRYFFLKKRSSLRWLDSPQNFWFPINLMIISVLGTSNIASLYALWIIVIYKCY